MTVWLPQLRKYCVLCSFTGSHTSDLAKHGAAIAALAQLYPVLKFPQLFFKLPFLSLKTIRSFLLMKFLLFSA